MNNEPIGYGTGALQAWDTKNANFPVSALLDKSAAPTSKVWRLSQRVNQGNEPKCVGASLAQELAAEPVEIPISFPYTTDNIYNLAQKLDDWPGESYDGTSLLAGLKALKQYGYIGEYRWAANVDDVALSLSQLGPVCMAGPWLSGMFTPTSEGRVTLTGSAGDMGHAYLLGELDVAKGRAYIEQTWGPSWSVLGWRGWFTLEDIGKLLGMGTQAAIITQRFNPAPSPPPPDPYPAKVVSGVTVTYTDGTSERFLR